MPSGRIMRCNAANVNAVMDTELNIMRWADVTLRMNFVWLTCRGNNLWARMIILKLFLGYEYVDGTELV